MLSTAQFTLWSSILILLYRIYAFLCPTPLFQAPMMKLPLLVLSLAALSQAEERYCPYSVEIGACVNVEQR
jgi:hypothetical protein